MSNIAVKVICFQKAEGFREGGGAGGGKGSPLPTSVLGRALNVTQGRSSLENDSALQRLKAAMGLQRSSKNVYYIIDKNFIQKNKIK